MGRKFDMLPVRELIDIVTRIIPTLLARKDKNVSTWPGNGLNGHVDRYPFRETRQHFNGGLIQAAVVITGH
jgi:hypothetical protein